MPNFTKVVRLTISCPKRFRDDSPTGTYWRVGGDNIVQVVRWRDPETVWVKR